MTSKYCLVVLVLYYAVSTTVLVAARIDKQTAQNSSIGNDSEIDNNKKIGLVTGVVTTNGFNSQGQSSTYVAGGGAQAGIIHKNGTYTPLFNEVYHGGQTYQTGAKPPDSYGVVSSAIQPGHVGGSAYGDVENADKKDVFTMQHKSESKQALADGSILWNGLKSNTKKQSEDVSKQTEQTSS